MTTLARNFVGCLFALAAFSLHAAATGPELLDLEGKPHRPTDVRTKAAVLVFVMHDCPISNAYAPELNRIATGCAEKGVPFFLIYADTDVKDQQLARHAKEYGYRCPTLIDRTRELVKHVGATVAPQAFVLGQDGSVKYQGRIDDRYAGFGKPRPAPTKRDLRDAVESVLAGIPVAEPKTPAFGCSLE